MCPALCDLRRCFWDLETIKYMVALSDHNLYRTDKQDFLEKLVRRAVQDNNQKFLFKLEDEYLKNDRPVPPVLIRAALRHIVYTYGMAARLVEQKRDVPAILLKQISQDPPYAADLIKKLLYHKQPVPDILLQTALKSDDLVKNLLPFYLKRNTPVPLALLQKAAQNARTAFAIAQKYLEKYQPLPDVLLEVIVKDAYYAKMLAREYAALDPKYAPVPDVLKKYAILPSDENEEASDIRNKLLQKISKSDKMTVKLLTDYLDNDRQIPDYVYKILLPEVTGSRVVRLILEMMARGKSLQGLVDYLKKIEGSRWVYMNMMEVFAKREVLGNVALTSYLQPEQDRLKILLNKMDFPEKELFALLKTPDDVAYAASKMALWTLMDRSREQWGRFSIKKVPERLMNVLLKNPEAARYFASRFLRSENGTGDIYMMDMGKVLTHELIQTIASNPESSWRFVANIDLYKNKNIKRPLPIPSEILDSARKYMSLGVWGYE